MSQDSSSRIAKRRSAALQDGGADYAERRSELIRVAAEVFRAKGFGAATLNDIAAVFGTDRASLYYYVGSKQELFEECVTLSVSENVGGAREIAATDASPRDKMLALIRLIIESQVTHYPYQYVYIQENMQQVASQEAAWAQTMVERTHELEHVFLDIIAEGVADGSFRKDLSNTLIANSLFGMTQWTHRWYVPGQSKYGAEDLIRVFSAIFFEGIDTRD
jgi:AcrR family transcriptional regulator